MIDALVLAGHLVAGAGQDPTRIDVYDARGRRDGYIVIDRDRLDVFDARSRRRGYGRIRSNGSVDLFAPDGSRSHRLTPPRRGR
jgi:hypothetical protein